MPDLRSRRLDRPAATAAAAAGDARPDRARAVLDRPLALARRAHRAAARRRLPRRPPGPPRRRGRSGSRGRRCWRSWAPSCRRPAPRRATRSSRCSRSTAGRPGVGAAASRRRARARAGARRVLRRDVGGDQHVPPRPAAARHVRRAALRAVLAVRLRPRALRAVLGRDRAGRCCATRRARSWRRARRSRRPTWCCGCCASRCPRTRPATGEADPRDGQALALLQAIGGFQAFRRAIPAPPKAGLVGRFLLYERALPGLRGRTRSRRCTTRSARPTRATAARRRCCGSGG